MFLNKYLKFAGPQCSYNPLIALVYLIAFPVVKISQKLGLTPNFITFCSFIFSLFAVYSLYENKLIQFTIFWFCSYILDFTDGTLARMTNNVRKTALRVDHLSDLIKIALIILGFGLYYDHKLMWVVVFVTNSLFFFYAVLNHDLCAVKKVVSVKNVIENGSDKVKDQTKEKINKRTFTNEIKRYYRNIFYVVDGHTLIIFFFIPLGKVWAYSFLSYFCLILSYQSMCRIRDLLLNPKI